MSTTTSANAVDIVQSLSDEKSHTLVPLTVCLFVLMMFGIIGNILVVIYYGFVSKLSTNTFFIVVLAIYDLLFCCTCLPTEIYANVNYYTFTNSTVCKSFRFISYLCLVGSGLNLAAIALDRYKRICKPSQVQWTIKHAKIMSIVLFFVTVIFTWPAASLFDSQEISLREQINTTISGRDCTFTEDEEDKLYVRLFSGLKLILFIVCTGTLCVLYIIIGRAIFRQRKVLAQYKKNVSKENSVNVTLERNRQHEQDFQTNETSGLPESSRDDIIFQQPVCETSMSSYSSDKNENIEEPSKATEITCSTVKRAEGVRQTGINHDTIMITIVMIVVTGVFVLSFLPYLSLIIWRIRFGRRGRDGLASVNFVAYHFGIRSYILNSTVNPWIYGTFNRNFRYFFYLKCMACCRPKMFRCLQYFRKSK